MPDSPDEFELSLPCPSCSYDLRAQIDPRCPECGRAFASIENLRAIAMDTKLVLNRVLMWRFKFSIAYILALAWIPVALILLDMLTQQPGVTMTLGILIAVVPAFTMPLLAAYFLMRVLKLRFDTRVGHQQRRALNGSIPLLLFYTLPALVFLPPIIMSVFKKAWLGLGI